MNVTPAPTGPRSALARVAFLLGALLALVLTPAHTAQLLPGIYGYGTERVSGSVPTANTATSGTRVIKVTTLADSGSNSSPTAGSLRAAIVDPDTNPRFVVFEVSGIIELKAQLTIANGNITIAGQTAPGTGIALHGAPLVVTASNVLVQHIRVRPGDRWLPGLVNQGRDALGISNSAAVVKNVVFDHCTFGWSLDEVASTWYSWEDITFHRCIFAEPLDVSIHLDEGTFDVDPNQAGNQNEPWQAELLSVSGSTGVTFVNPPATSTHLPGVAIKDYFQIVDFPANGASVEYTVPLVSSSSTRWDSHVVIAGITGPDRCKFVAEMIVGGGVRQTSEEFDMYSASTELKTFVARVDVAGYNIPANTTSITIRLTASGWTSTRRKLGVDLVSLSQGHGMGPLFNNGGTAGGRISVIGSIIAHVRERGPWTGSKHFVFVNNVLYNRRNKFLTVGDTQWTTAINAAVIGNTFIEGPSLPANSTNAAMRAQQASLPTGSRFYETDNEQDRGNLSSPPKIDTVLDQTFRWSTNPTAQSNGLVGLIPVPRVHALKNALFFAGARPRNRDIMEARIVDEIATALTIQTPSTRPGGLKHAVAPNDWPAFSAPAITLTAPAAGDTDGDGYSDIEEWLHALATTVEGRLTPDNSIQAENAVLAGGCTLQVNHAGYHGEGFVDFPANNGTITFNNVDGGSGGAKLLRIRYALSGTAGSSRTGQLIVNGATQSITFYSTLAFTNWRTMDVTVTLNAGKTNTLVLKSTGADLANIDEISLVGPALFDDFDDGNSNGWRTINGTWSIATAGSNSAFRQSDSSATVTSFALLDNDWDEQSITADAKVVGLPVSSSWFGLVTRYQDPANYYYAKLSATGAEIKKLVRGEPLTLATGSFAAVVGNVYTVKLEVIGNQLKLFVDGAEVATATDDTFSAGKVGLIMYRAAIDYDNVFADPTPAGSTLLSDNFSAGAGSWTASSGTWSVVSGVYKQANGGATVMARSSRGGNWSDQVVQAKVTPVTLPTGDWFGIAARYQNTTNYYYLKAAGGNSLELRKLVNNVQTTLASKTLTLTAGTPYTLKLEVVGTSLRAYVNGTLQLRANDTAFASGAAGMALLTWESTADFDDVVVTSP